MKLNPLSSKSDSQEQKLAPTGIYVLICAKDSPLEQQPVELIITVHCDNFHFQLVSSGFQGSFLA